VKLILFTADDSPEVHNEALENGVDVVLVKSPDAAEIVNLVAETIVEKEKSREKDQ
jgi:DNA-binding NarL/FixJ family response regulator